MGEPSGHVLLQRDYWVLSKLWHAVDGVYIWEFITTLDYEWDVIRGHRRYRWTIWVYSLARVASLLTAITNLIGLDAATPINCQDWVISNFIFAYLALASSSLLVAFRVIAIWGKNKIIVALAFSVWIINISFLIQGIVRIRAEWDSEQYVCVIQNIESNQLTVIVILATDVILLSTMLVGLLRLRRGGGGKFELGRLLWKQGVIWLLIGTVAELTPVLFISLYLSDTVNIMFLMPALLTMSIAATWMYRSLSDFISSVDVVHASDSFPRSNRRASSTKLYPSVPVPAPPRAEVNVNVSHDTDQYMIPQSSPCFSFADSDSQERGRLHGSSYDGDQESAGEIGLKTISLHGSYYSSGIAY